MTKKRVLPHKHKPRRLHALMVLAVVAIFLLAAGGWWVARGRAQAPKEAPEAQKVLDVQANMPFQILIPAYMPREFERAAMVIDVNQSGPGGEPLVHLTYRTRQGQPVFLKEWVPVNPGMEILAGSRPIQTKWGQGWLLQQGDQLAAIWVDVGPLRISLYTTQLKLIGQEQLLAMAESLGPASNRQVFEFIVDPPSIQEMPPPPPVAAQLSAEGVQEVDLIVTPGGYNPIRFAVKKGVPVRVTFRQLGQVGCGNELNLPIGGGNLLSARLATPEDTQVIEFTPQVAGQFGFYCAHQMYRGLMFVEE